MRWADETERLREYERRALVDLVRFAIEGDGMTAGETTDPATVATRLLDTGRVIVLPAKPPAPAVWTAGPR